MKQKLLHATGDELSRLLGEALIEPKHHMASTLGFKCEKCGIEISEEIAKKYPPGVTSTQVSEVMTEMIESSCPVHSDPIPLTPDNAFKWRDWAVEEYGAKTVYYALRDLYYGKNDKLYALANATPSDYLIAAALCKLNAEEAKPNKHSKRI